MWVTSLVTPNLMAAQAARGNGGMNELALGLVLVALGALCRIDVFVQRDGMNRGCSLSRQKCDQREENTGVQG